MLACIREQFFEETIRRLHQSLEPFLNCVLSTLVPSSSCSATLGSGNEAGMIRRGEAPLLHQLEAFHGRIVYARPPDRSAIVHEHI